MAQTRQQNGALRSRYAQSAVTPTAMSSARTACAQLEQLDRKLSAAHAEIRRYQTRLFACERQMNALRMENTELETACQQARLDAVQAQARVEELEQQLAQVLDETLDRAMPEMAQPVHWKDVTEPAEEMPPPGPPEQTAAPAEQQAAAEPEWKPTTELEQLSVELLNWFDAMMGR